MTSDVAFGLTRRLMSGDARLGPGPGRLTRTALTSAPRSRQRYEQEGGRAARVIHSSGVLERPQQLLHFRCLMVDSGSVTRCSTTSPSCVMVLIWPSEQSIAPVDDVGFVVGTGDHRTRRVAALHDAANWDPPSARPASPVASATDRTRLGSGAEQSSEIGSRRAVGLVGERLVAGFSLPCAGCLVFPAGAGLSGSPSRGACCAASGAGAG